MKNADNPAHGFASGETQWSGEIFFRGLSKYEYAFCAAISGLAANPRLADRSPEWIVDRAEDIALEAENVFNGTQRWAQDQEGHGAVPVDGDKTDSEPA